MESEGRVALAEANLTNAEVNLRRQIELSHKDVDSASALDDAQRVRDGDVAEVKMAQGQLALARRIWIGVRFTRRSTGRSWKNS